MSERSLIPLEEINALRHTEYNSDPTVMEMLDTIEALWLVTRAAQRVEHSAEYIGGVDKDDWLALQIALADVEQKSEGK